MTEYMTYKGSGVYNGQEFIKRYGKWYMNGIHIKSWLLVEMLEKEYLKQFKSC